MSIAPESEGTSGNLPRPPPSHHHHHHHHHHHQQQQQQQVQSHPPQQQQQQNSTPLVESTQSVATNISNDANVTNIVPVQSSTQTNTPQKGSLNSHQQLSDTTNVFSPSISSHTPSQLGQPVNVSAPNVGFNIGAKPKTPRPKQPRQPGSAKSKSRRKSTQSGAQDNVILHVGPSTAGGTIGAAADHAVPALLSAGGGGRKALPELVLPFKLPFSLTKPPFPLLDNASPQERLSYDHESVQQGRTMVQIQPRPYSIKRGLISQPNHKRSNTADHQQESDSDSQQSSSDSDSDDDSDTKQQKSEQRRKKREFATIEESMVLLQSLRQSRLSHLSSLLPPFSQKVRSGMIYPNVAPLSLLHGLNPREPHVLIQLGRADIHVGPHVFVKTKFWEVRPDFDPSPNMLTHVKATDSGPYGANSTFCTSMTDHHFEDKKPQVSLQQSSVISPNVSTKQQYGISSQPGNPRNNDASNAHNSPPCLEAGASAVANPNHTLPSSPGHVMASSAPTRPLTSNKTDDNSAVSKSTVAAYSTASAGTSSEASTTNGSAATGSNVQPTNPQQVAAVSLPRPTSIPSPHPPPSSITPALPCPPSLSQNAPSGSPSPIVSQHVQFAPPRLSPIAQPFPTLQRKGALEQPKVTASAQKPPVSSQNSPSTASSATNTNGQPVQTPRPIPPPAPRPINHTPVQSRPTIPAPPAIDAVLVSRVNATAALNPELQELLHIAASGRASPNQLKALGVWIQAITAQLREDETRAAATSTATFGTSPARPTAAATAPLQPIGSPFTAQTPVAASHTLVGKPKKGRKSKQGGEDGANPGRKSTKAEEKEAKKRAKAEAKAVAAAQKQQLAAGSVKPRPPPPGWPTDGPPHPPIVILEFRENPSMRFVLPLWKCVVERKEGVEPTLMPKIKREKGFFDNDSDDEDAQGIEPELKLSFFVPAIGSDAADGSGLKEVEAKIKVEENQSKDAAAGMTTHPGQAAAVASNIGTDSLPSTPPPVSNAALPLSATPNGSPGREADLSSPSAIAATPATKKKLSKKAQKLLEAEAKAKATSAAVAGDESKRHEQYPVTWYVKGGVTESMWEAFGRVPGAITNAVVRPIKKEPEIELEPEVAEFLVPEIKYHLLDQPVEEIKICKETTDAFVDLYSNLPDRHFLLPRIPPFFIPAGLEEHLSDKFTVRPQAISVRPVAKRKAGANKEEELGFGLDGVGGQTGNGGVVETPPKPPKRKRHVATHNPDGSIKSCGACGKTKTPMWRRGPKGPSQLCNACGARWKAGRLVVPEVAPPILEAENDAAKAEEKKLNQIKAEEKQPGMLTQGTGAIIIPQSGGMDVSNYNLLSGPFPTNGSGFSCMAPTCSSISVSNMSFAPLGGNLEHSQTPSPFKVHTQQSGTSGMAPTSASPASFGMAGTGSIHMGEDELGNMRTMDLCGSGQPSPSPFIRSPNPYEGPETIPASVDPSVLCGGSNSSRSLSR